MTAFTYDPTSMRAIEATTTTRTVEPYTVVPESGARLVTYATPWLRTAVANSWLAFRWLLIAGAGVLFVLGVWRVGGWIA